MTLYNTSQTKLYRQVVSDLVLDEGVKEYAYADPLSPLYRKLKPSVWGTKPARELLPAGTDWAKGEPWTVGIGYTKGVNVDSRMDRLRAERLTEGEVASLDAQLLAALPWYKDTSFVTKTVLINMAYNLGLRGLLQFKNSLAFIKAGDWKKAARNLEQSLWYKQVGNRAKRLITRIETQTIALEHLA